jgi:hypothetical protein
MNKNGWREVARSYRTHNLDECESPKKQTKFKIRLLSTDGKILESWISKSYPRFESGVWNFRDQHNGLPVRITGGIVTVTSFETEA